MKKVTKLISDLVLAVLVIAVLIFALPRLFGVHMFSVLSGSMEPSYHVGDLIYAVPAEADEIEAGDVISFLLNDDGRVATHRVVEVEEGNQRFYTKGDANEVRDGSPVHYNNVIGVVRFRIPLLGYAAGFLSTMAGKITAVTLIAVYVILILIFSKGKKQEESLD